MQPDSRRNHSEQSLKHFPTFPCSSLQHTSCVCVRVCVYCICMCYIRWHFWVSQCAIGKKLLEQAVGVKPQKHWTSMILNVWLGKKITYIHTCIQGLFVLDTWSDLHQMYMHIQMLSRSAHSIGYIQRKVTADFSTSIMWLIDYGHILGQKATFYLTKFKFHWKCLKFVV